MSTQTHSLLSINHFFLSQVGGSESGVSCISFCESAFPLSRWQKSFAEIIKGEKGWKNKRMSEETFLHKIQNQSKIHRLFIPFLSGPVYYPKSNDEEVQEFQREHYGSPLPIHVGFCFWRSRSSNTTKLLVYLISFLSKTKLPGRKLSNSCPLPCWCLGLSSFG